MAIATKKKTAVILKDSNGSLFQALPETNAEYVSYESTNVDAELSRQADYDVAQAYTEIDSHSVPGTETIHTKFNGIIQASNDSNGIGSSGAGAYYDGAFRIQLYDEYGFLAYVYYNRPDAEVSVANLWLGNFYEDEDNPVPMSTSKPEYFKQFDAEYGGSQIQIPGNKRYYLDVQIDPLNVQNTTGIMISFNGCGFYNVDNSDVEDYIAIMVLGSDDIENSIYESHNVDNYSQAIAFTFPAVGQSSTLYFNSYYNYNNYTDQESTDSLEDQTSRSFTIENIDGTNFRLSFFWSTEKDVEVETTTTWKELKTTVEREDGTETVVNKPISGLLQDVSGSCSEKIQMASLSTNNSYGFRIAIGDSGGTNGRYSYNPYNQ